MGYYHFRMGRVQGMEAIVSRTGYTGEDGFEIYFKSDAAAASKLFLDLAEKGEKYDALPAGLGARDTLRLEAKMALYGNDIDDSHTVLEADLGWILKLKKESRSSARRPWPGRKPRASAASWSGFELVDKGIARHGYPVIVQGREFGAVTSRHLRPLPEKSRSAWPTCRWKIRPSAANSRSASATKRSPPRSWKRRFIKETSRRN